MERIFAKIWRMHFLIYTLETYSEFAYGKYFEFAKINVDEIIKEVLGFNK